MATATMATAAGAAALLYYTLNKKLQKGRSSEEDDENVNNQATVGIDRVSHRMIQAPATWLETISTLSETLRFTYSETLGKWPIGDLAFGINFLLKRQGNLHVCSVFGGEDSLQLEGPDIIAELRYFLNLLTLCWHFSKKPFVQFLEETGYSIENVLLHEPKAGILKPAFTILADHKTKYFLLLIRGTHSIKDTLTAATGAVVPFHHSVVYEGGVSNLVLGYAHCGMVAAARWIAKLSTPCLTKALGEYPDYKVKEDGATILLAMPIKLSLENLPHRNIAGLKPEHQKHCGASTMASYSWFLSLSFFKNTVVGHSLGGGTAALLTYILREQKELSNTTCVTFAPGACMTWELAESGNDFVVSIINGADLVPTFSAGSVDDLRAEVTASAWINDLRNQIERTRILCTVYRSASALSSRLPSIASAKAKVAGAGAILRPVSSSTRVVMRRAQSIAQAAWVRPSLLSSWSCMGPRHRVTAVSNAQAGDSSEPSSRIESSEPLLTSPTSAKTSIESTELPISSSEGLEWSSEIECSCSDEMGPHSHGDACLDEDEDEDIMAQDRHEDRMTEAELWQQIEQELYNRADGEEADVASEIREEEAAAIAEVGDGLTQSSALEMKEAHRFFPPGKIMHIVTLLSERAECEGDDDTISNNTVNAQSAETSKVGIFLTPRSLYSKLRLSQTMISDHFMPVYRRQIEKLIRELEKEEVSNADDHYNKKVEEVAL